MRLALPEYLRPETYLFSYLRRVRGGGGAKNTIVVNAVSGNRRGILTGNTSKIVRFGAPAPPSDE